MALQGRKVIRSNCSNQYFVNAIQTGYFLQSIVFFTPPDSLFFFFAGITSRHADEVALQDGDRHQGKYRISNKIRSTNEAYTSNYKHKDKMKSSVKYYLNNLIVVMSNFMT